MHQTSEKANGVFVCTVHINDNDNTNNNDNNHNNNNDNTYIFLINQIPSNSPFHMVHRNTHWKRVLDLQ